MLQPTAVGLHQLLFALQQNLVLFVVLRYVTEQLRTLDNLGVQRFRQVRQQKIVSGRIDCLVLVTEVDLVQADLVLGVVTVWLALRYGTVKIVLRMVALIVAGETIGIDIGKLVVTGLKKKRIPVHVLQGHVRVAGLHVVAAFFVAQGGVVETLRLVWSR